MPDEVLIEVSGVDVIFSGQTVISGVDLCVRRGELVTLIGPNGAGKTTLVRVILGLLPPTRGSVTLMAGIRIGYMPQRVVIDETLPIDVGRFLTLGARVADEQVMKVLREVGADHIRHTAVQRISGGEMQRVLLARALLREPDLLVLDEPVQGVDITGQEELYDLITRIRDRRGCGVLMVSHDLHLVMAATDQVLCLNQHVCCSGHPESVSRHPAYLELFGSRVAVYTHHHDHTHDVHGDVVHPGTRGGGDG
jgi:zinc transport system ATP-binding protein